MKLWTIALAALTLAACQHANAQRNVENCIPPDYDRAGLEALRAGGFVLPGAARDRFALRIAACLADPDPFLRDRIAYEGIHELLRQNQLSDTARAALFRSLWQRLNEPDAAGFAQPFNALVLSDLIRSDAAHEFIAQRELDNFASDAARYVSDVRDYRGFDETEGWRHGIAHGADLLTQLARHPRIDGPWLDGVLDASASQIVAHNGHSYIYGEGERLAAVMLAAVRRGVRDEAYWTAFFGRIASPAPLTSWNEAFRSQAGLAKRHNTIAYLTFAYTIIRFSGEELAPALPGAEAALRAVP